MKSLVTIERAATLGVVAGLLYTVGNAAHQHIGACAKPPAFNHHNASAASTSFAHCIDSSIVAVASPYVTHALVGGAVAVAAALLLATFLSLVRTIRAV